MGKLASLLNKGGCDSLKETTEDHLLNCNRNAIVCSVELKQRALEDMLVIVSIIAFNTLFSLLFYWWNCSAPN